MSQVRFAAIFAVFVGVLGVASLRAARPRKDTGKLAGATVTGVENPTLGYKKWKQVNAKPHEISSALSALCISPTPEQVAKEASNPHLDQRKNAPPDKSKFVVVFVNEIGKEAMLNQKCPVFPVGSILVKEKLARASSLAPEMLTAIRKREKGYNPATDDWEYSVLNGDGTAVLAQGQLKKCEACHSDYKKTDFVARTYLSTDMLRRLK